MTGSLELVDGAVSSWLTERRGDLLVLGLCGAQGSGKSTLAAGLAQRVRERGLRAAVLSLDDLYLSRAERGRLAADLHPLLRTRGVPLTHDVEFGKRLIVDLRAGRPVRLPRFDKATDEPLPQWLWETVDPPLDLLIFEGWCVGARPQPEAELSQPINSLERERDPGGRWRRAVNAALAGPYADLFAELDRLILLRAPDFEVVRHWRLEQEETLRRGVDDPDKALLMDSAAVDLFVQHYERITRMILSEMPSRADLVVSLDESREPKEAA